jgi:hypothetical protein
MDTTLIKIEDLVIRMIRKDNDTLNSLGINRLRVLSAAGRVARGELNAWSRQTRRSMEVHISKEGDIGYRGKPFQGAISGWSLSQKRNHFELRFA